MKSRSSRDKTKLVCRIIALVMAILMVGGVAYYTFYMLSSALR